MSENKKDFQKQRGRNKHAVVVKNTTEEIRSARRSVQKLEERNMCFCPHTDSEGRLALTSVKGARSDITGAPMFACRLCTKYIDISEITDDDFIRAVDTIDRYLDVIKMCLSNSSEEDMKDLKRCAKFQKFLNGKFRDLATAAKRKNKKKKNRSSGDSRFTINRPVSR